MIDFFLDAEVAYRNFVDYVGYTPPQVSIEPERLVTEGLIPTSLADAVVRPEQFAPNQQLMALTVEGQRLYDQAWSKFKAG